MNVELATIRTDTRVWFTVPGHPVPKARARVVVRNGTSRGVTPKRTRAYEAHARAFAKMAAGAKWDASRAFSVRLDIYRADARRYDGDNLEKAILDAGNGILWTDDHQVREMRWTKNVDKQRPRVEVTVEVVR